MAADPMPPGARSEPHLVIEGVHKRFGEVNVLEGIDLAVERGEFVALLGSSGSGKTTLLRIIAGLEAPDQGTVRLGGRLLFGESVNVTPDRRRVGIVPQEGALFPHLDALDNIGFGLKRAHRRGDRVHELGELLNLQGLERRRPHELSGGQQQRVAVARCLAPRPDLVLLDEPFAALDASLRATVRQDVRTALLATQTTAILVTHDQDEALLMASTVAVMHRGVVLQAATPQTLYSSPRTLTVATFVGESNLVDAVVRGGQAHSAFGCHDIGSGGPIPDGMNCTIVIRPEQVDFSGSPAQSRTQDNHDFGSGVIATVEQIEYHGHDALVVASTLVGVDPTAAGPKISARVGPSAIPHIGERVLVSVRGPVLAFPNR